MPPCLRHAAAFCLLAFLVAEPAGAQAQTVVPRENVRLDYAQVLGVEPVYQILRATRMEQQCDVPAETRKPQKSRQDDGDEEGRFARVVDSVKGIFDREDAEPEQQVAPPAPSPKNCRMVPIEREFRRPIAYDVDYMYKGTKYRSRLAEDPGNRLRVRVSVIPYVPGQVVVNP